MAKKPKDQPNLSNTGATLLSCILSIESLEEEKAEVAERISEEKKAIKNMGFDGKVVAELLKRRRMKPEERDERDSLLAAYEEAIEAANMQRKIGG